MIMVTVIKTQILFSDEGFLTRVSKEILMIDQGVISPFIQPTLLMLLWMVNLSLVHTC